MADIIRRAVIEIETRQKRSRLEAPGAADTAGFKAQTEAAGKAEAATNKASDATKRHAEVVRSSAYTMVKDFREAGEGAFRMARGLTLLAASGSDDLKKLVQQVAIAQGAFDVFAGGFKTITNLAKIVGGPWAAAITGVTAALGTGIAMWNRWEQAAVEAAQAAETARQNAIKFQNQQREAWEEQQNRERQVRDRRQEISRLRIDAGLTPQETSRRLAAESSRLVGVSADIDRDEARRLRGFTPGKFGGNAKAAFDALLSFGSSSELSNARDIEQRRQDVAEQQLEIARRGFDVQKELLESQTQSARRGLQGVSGFLGLFGANTSGFTSGANAQLLEVQRANEERLATRTRDALDKIVQAIERAATRTEQIDRKLDSVANSK